MAKKKKQELTREELLAEALVREEDWPYEVPGNWVWTRLGSVTTCSKEKFNDFDSVDEIKYIGLEHIQKDLGIIGHGSSKDIKSQKSVFEVGDILYGKLRPYLNKHDIADFEGICSTDILVLKTKPICVNKLLNYYLNTDYFICNAIANSKGINLPRVSETIVLDTNFPLPPLAEQQRIVDRIESLFDKLDQAKELIQEALDSFENRKAAILHQAFTGQLTKKWREAHGVGLESWEEKHFSDIGKLERGRSKHRPRNAPELFGGVYPFIQTGDIANANIFIKEHKQNLSELGLKQSRLFPRGTLCITIAANIGDVAILDYDCCFPDSVVGFTPNEKTVSKFIYYYMCVIKSDLEHFAPATAQKNINLKILNEIKIKMPLLEEQQEIDRILDDLFAKEQNAKDLCVLIDQIEAMKKTILGQAFRGELGTNEAGEESAVELLKVISK